MSPTGGVKTVTSFRLQTIPGWDFDRKGTIEVNITVRACNRKGSAPISTTNFIITYVCSIDPLR